ncbi:hypothetical protein GGX14DRAFT_393992 [Mycena pura]|uniref:Uncharacterized protein n=1 Tax=Mycena pura TaxID=153505 RepID=A0AAD6VFX4_9AGAR|nr:hypothetical protein GGX14DRAFT_393992 [Mycena pura]
MASRFWSAFNHSGTRLFVNVLRKLSANVDIPANVASNAMNVGIRATRYLFAQLSDTEPPEDILALVGLVHQLCELVPMLLPSTCASQRSRLRYAPFIHFGLFAPLTRIQDRLLPENFQVPFWAAPTELELANAPTFPQSPRKTPARLSSIANQQDDDGEEEQDEEDDDGDFEMERPGKTPTPPPSPPKGKRTRPTTRSERKSAEYVEDSDDESVPASKIAKSSRSGNAAQQSRQPRSVMNREAAVVLKKPKDKNEGKPKGRNIYRVGDAIVSILNTKETFHKRVNLDLPEDAGATITVAVARKGPGVKPPFRSAMGSTPHARTRENDDFESEFAPLEPIPLKRLNRSRSIKPNSNLFATIAKQNTFSLEMTKYVVDDLKATIARAKRDYDLLRLSISAVKYSVCRTIEHARAATDVLGTDGLLSYFEAPKSSQDPNAVDLLNRLIENFNSMKAAPGDSIASTSAPATAPDDEDDSVPGLSQRPPATPANKKPLSKAPRSESRVIRDVPEGDNDK